MAATDAADMQVGHDRGRPAPERVHDRARHEARGEQRHGGRRSEQAGGAGAAGQLERDPGQHHERGAVARSRQDGRGFELQEGQAGDRGASRHRHSLVPGGVGRPPGSRAQTAIGRSPGRGSTSGQRVPV